MKQLLIVVLATVISACSTVKGLDGVSVGAAIGGGIAPPPISIATALIGGVIGGQVDKSH